MARTATYTYCIVHRPRRPDLRRVPGGVPGSTRPELLEAGKALWLVVGDVPLARYGPKPLEQTLRDLDRVAEIAVAHAAVVEHFMRETAATVVPMKLLTLFSTRDRALEHLRNRQSEVAGILERIRGCAEWGVRVNRTGGAGAARANILRAASGTAFLTARKEARDRARDDAHRVGRAAEEAFALLSGIARESKRRTDVPEGATTPPLLEATFLVPLNRSTRFQTFARRAADSCRKAGGILTLTGPWPAYNFVQPGGTAS